jgi:hypothetical protein
MMFDVLLVVMNVLQFWNHSLRSEIATQVQGSIPWGEYVQGIIIPHHVLMSMIHKSVSPKSCLAARPFESGFDIEEL